MYVKPGEVTDFAGIFWANFTEKMTGKTWLVSWEFSGQMSPESIG